MRKRLLMIVALVMGSCIWARAADPNTTDEMLFENGGTVKVADASAINSQQPVHVTIVKAGDPKATKLLITTDAAKPTPFKDKIVRVQVASGNRNEIFTLENVRLVSLLGNEFIVGTAVKYGTDRFSGLEIYLNARLVMTIVAMTPEQAKKFNEMQQPRFVPPTGNPPSPFNPQPGNQPQRGRSTLEGGPPLPGQRPYNPSTPPPGINPQPPGQGPYTPPQGANPPQGGQGPYNPPQGFNPPQGGQGPYNPPQGGQGPYNPPRGNQGPYNPPQGGQGPYNPPQGGQGPYNPPQGGQGPYNPPQGGQGPYNPTYGYGPRASGQAQGYNLNPAGGSTPNQP